MSLTSPTTSADHRAGLRLSPSDSQNDQTTDHVEAACE